MPRFRNEGVKLRGPDCGRGRNDCMSNIAEIVKKNSIDLRIVDPKLNPEKNDYKRVFNWKDAERYDGAADLENKQLIIINSEKYSEIDFDFLKHLPPAEGAAVKSVFPETLSFGRNGAGHYLYEVEDIPEHPEGTKRIDFMGSTINEYRSNDCYSIFYGPLDPENKAEIKGDSIRKIKYSKLKNIFNWSSALAALCMMKPEAKEGTMNNWLVPIVGEFKKNNIPEDQTQKIFEKFLVIKNRSDRVKETEATIRGIYKKDGSSNIFSKTYPVHIDQESKFQFRAIIERLQHKQEKKKKKLISHTLIEYVNLGIPKPKFLVNPLLRENSINFISGPKGKGKTEFTLGLTNMLARGMNFLNYEIEEPTPIYFVDGEMDPYDLVERNELYADYFDFPKDQNYFKICNYSLQEEGIFPDLRDPIFQQQIIDELELQRKQTSKNPILILDNLRSLSAYEENDADSWLPIGKFLLQLRGSKFTTIVIDHHGKEAKGPRGTSSKTDWANLSLLISSEKKKGDPLMRLKIVFDKARGLKPAQAEDFVATYDFKGKWQSEEYVDKKKEDDESWAKKIYELKIAHEKEEQRWEKHLEKEFKLGRHDQKTHEIIIKNHKANSNLSQKKIAASLGIAAGKVNRLMKPDGPVDQYANKMVNVVPEKRKQRTKEEIAADNLIHRKTGKRAKRKPPAGYQWNES